MSIAESGLVASFHLGSMRVPRGQQFEAWREITRPLFDTAPLKDERRFSAAVSAYALDHVLVTRVALDQQGVRRGPEHLRAGNTDHFALRLYTRGGLLAEIADAPVVLSPRSISLFDLRHGMRGCAPPSEALGVMIPRRMIDERPFRMAPGVLWAATSPQGRVLITALLTLWHELPRTRQADGGNLAAGLVGLINGLLASSRDEESCATVERATLRAMQAFIAANLHDRRLDATRLGAVFGCSRARAYRLFKPCGGIDRYIRRQRLERCFQELARGEPRSRRIGAVAGKWGFENPSHFHRLFKQRFAVTPSDVVGIARGHDVPARPSIAHAPSDRVSELHSWIRQL